MALTNTMATAENLGIEFRFIWPRGANPALHDLSQLFSPEFIAAFEIGEEPMVGREIFPQHELVASSRQEASRRLSSFAMPPGVEVDDPFGIVRLADEDPSEAHARFLRAFESIGWSKEAWSLVHAAATWTDGNEMSAVHVRAGDIVNGDWRQIMYFGKYMPVPYVSHAIAHGSGEGTRLTLVMSDNTDLLAWLCTVHPTVVTVADLVPEYGQLPEFLRALADILIMSRCRTIAGPSASAFSSLAGHLGGSGVTSVEQLVPIDQRFEILRAGILDIRRASDASPFLRSFAARDIVWLLDVFGDRLSLDEQLAHAREAERLDPEFMSARTRVGLLAALLGRWSAARDAVAVADALGRATDRHQDALFEARASGIAVECLAIALEATAPRWRTWSSRTRKRAGMKASLAALQGATDGLGDWHIFEFDRDKILATLRDLLETVGRLAELNDDMLAPVLRSLNRWHADDVDITCFRPENHGAHQSAAIFEGLLRQFERVAISLSRAIEAAGVDGTTRSVAAG
jgi:hypothetical protein